MARPYKMLRAKMIEKEMDQTAVADLIGVARATVSEKMNGKAEWRMGEVWKLMDALEIEPSQMPVYFSRNGRNTCI